MKSISPHTTQETWMENFGTLTAFHLGGSKHALLESHIYRFILKMSSVQTLLGFLLIISVVLLFLSYSPTDETNTWILFAVGVVFTGSG